MRSTRQALIVATISVAALGGCGGTHSSAAPLPHIAEAGSRAHIYESLDELATSAVAVVVAEPTGAEFSKPLPPWDGPSSAAPTPYVQMRVTKVLSGALQPGLIEVVSPGIDENTGRQALGRGGPYLMYLTLAIYAPDDPAGGYAVVGGPAGVYGAAGVVNQYVRIDGESPHLPRSITLGRTPLPGAAKTERQVLMEGPR